MTEKQYKLRFCEVNGNLISAIEDKDKIYTLKEIVDLLNKKEEEINELEKENEKLKQRIKEETDRVIKLEQYVYTKLCPKSEHYDEKELRYNYTGYRVYFDKKGKVHRYEEDDGDVDD